MRRVGGGLVEELDALEMESVGCHGIGNLD